MLQDIEKECVDFKPNYDESMMEPITLPSAFPFILCGNNKGIAVGMSSDIVSHNFTEVAAAIKYYLYHKDCTIADLMKFIKGPDFPTGGLIRNGEELLNIYTTGRGTIEVFAHYDVQKTSNGRTALVFHDVPYGVDIDPGIKAPLQKLVRDEGFTCFEHYECNKVGPKNFDITITLAKNADVASSLNILFKKTGLKKSININQTFIVDGNPKVLSLKDMITTWVDYRSNIIKRIAQRDYDRTNHKLTITIGLQKCMSNIDRVIEIVRNAASSAEAKQLLIKEFELTDEQASAVLEIKLARLSHLEVEELNKDKSNLETQLAKLNKTITDEMERYKQIETSLNSIKKEIGEDKRLTEIQYHKPIEEVADSMSAIKREWLVHSDGIHGLSDDGKPVIQDNLLGVAFAYDSKDIYIWSSGGEIGTIDSMSGTNEGGVTVREDGLDKIVTITKNGSIKVSLVSDYKLKTKEKAMRLKDDDKMIGAFFCNDNSTILLLDDTAHLLRLKVKDLNATGKATSGLKCGLVNLVAAALSNSDGDALFMMNADGKAKYTSVKDFPIGSRGNKGVMVNEGIITMFIMNSSRQFLYILPQSGKPLTIAADKISLKGKTAIGATLTNRKVKKVL